jgi:chromosome segregation ATPase
LKIPARVNLLLLVHQRRVDRAQAVLQHCNEQLRRAESERVDQHERLRDAQAQRQGELNRQGEVMGRHSGQVLCAADLVAARNRLEWWSARVDEQKERLAAAEASLLKSESDAAQARLRYQGVEARQRGLVRLVDERRRTVARDRTRIEDCNADDAWTAAANPACRVEPKLG